MSDTPWLSIIGLGEDGPEGLSGASRSVLESAEIVMGPPRHLALLGDVAAERIEWPVPFADGIETLLSLKGRRVVALASGDPFWFGAGSSITRHLTPGEWVAYPGRSTFSLAANRLGWALNDIQCHGLHAAALSRLRLMLAPGARALVLLRDGDAVHELATYLNDEGFDASTLHVLEALGGPRERIRAMSTAEVFANSFDHPVCAGLEIAGNGAEIPLASGRPDTIFETDGQITKRPVRALTLSALAPKQGERLWDIGGGSGSIGIEWLMSHPTLSAIAIEQNAARADRIRANAMHLGVDRLQVVTGLAPAVLGGLPKPDAVFVGGGLSQDLLDWLITHLVTGTRLVANAVTLETEALLLNAHERLGGDLLKVELSQAGSIGPRRGWKASYPIVQWSHRL